MFERFTSAARDTVVGARDQALALGHPAVGTPHLLLALLAVGAATPGTEDPAAGDPAIGEALRRHGASTEPLLARLGELVPNAAAGRATGPADRDPLTDDAEILALLGIDVDRIREAVETNFGPGALDRPLDPPKRPGLLDRLRRTRDDLRRSPGAAEDELTALSTARGSGGRLPLTRAAKKSLELALRESLASQAGEIRPEHLLLGLLRVDEGLARDLLDDLGTDVAALREEVRNGRRRSA